MGAVGPRPMCGRPPGARRRPWQWTMQCRALRLSAGNAKPGTEQEPRRRWAAIAALRHRNTNMPGVGSGRSARPVFGRARDESEDPCSRRLDAVKQRRPAFVPPGFRLLLALLGVVGL